MEANVAFKAEGFIRKDQNISVAVEQFYPSNTMTIKLRIIRFNIAD